MAASTEILQTTATDFGDIAYTTSGDRGGEPLVLVPGFQSSRTSWTDRGYVERLSDYRVLNVDPLGQGDSAKPHDEKAYTADAVVASVIAVLDAEGVDQAHIWGFSRGGFIAGLCGELATSRCRSIIMGGSPLGSASVDTLGELLRSEPLLAAGDWDGYWEQFPLPLPQPLIDHFIATNDPLANAATIRGLVTWHDAVPNFGLNDTGLPTLLYYGSGEVFAADLADAVVNAPIQVHEGPWAGHAETVMAVDEVLAVARGFLEHL